MSCSCCRDEYGYPKQRYSHTPARFVKAINLDGSIMLIGLGTIQVAFVRQKQDGTRAVVVVNNVTGLIGRELYEEPLDDESLMGLWNDTL